MLNVFDLSQFYSDFFENLEEQENKKIKNLEKFSHILKELPNDPCFLRRTFVSFCGCISVWLYIKILLKNSEEFDNSF